MKKWGGEAGRFRILARNPQSKWDKSGNTPSASSSSIASFISQSSYSSFAPNFFANRSSRILSLSSSSGDNGRSNMFKKPRLGAGERVCVRSRARRAFFRWFWRVLLIGRNYPEPLIGRQGFDAPDVRGCGSGRPTAKRLGNEKVRWRD
jgi:hypothetical protein